MTSLLAIPLKRSYDVDLVKPIKEVIDGTNSPNADDLNQIKDNVLSLNKMRSNCISKTLDVKHDGSLEMLEKYYDQLVSLEAKCPHIEISFKWKDAFEKGSSFFLSSNTLTISSISYEKVCILFNIGAIQSHLGVSHVSEAISNDNALKLSAKYFASAAGVFQALKHTASSAVGSHDLSVDLQNEVLNILQNLMLAQSQETFFLKATNDNMKEAIIAKIAFQCEEYYADVMKQIQVVKFNADKEWLSIVSVKQAVFHGIAEYYQSIVSQQNKEFGEQISRLQKAIECFKGAESRGGVPLNAIFRDYLNKCNIALEEAKKDNDFIYHAKIPDYKSLQTIGRAQLAKPAVLPNKFFPNIPDMFEKLLPLGIQQAVNKLELKKQEVVNTEVASLREMTQTMNAILVSLNLPAAIEDSSGSDVPKSLIDKSSAVRAKGGIEMIQKLINELPELLQRNKEILDENERALNVEEESDDNLRTQFKERWTRTPSSKLNQNWKEHIAKYRSILQNAIEADNKVKQKFSAHYQKMQLLSSGSPNTLANAIPSGSGSGSSFQNHPVVSKLKTLMSNVEVIKNEREVLESEIKNMTFNDMKNKFLTALSSDGAINELALSTEALGEAYGPIQKQIRESKERQETLVSDIQSLHNEFIQLKGSQSSASSEREAFLTELAAAYDAYMELLSNLEEGTKFYNDLTQLLVNLQNKIEDFCFARKAEREELCKDLQNEIVSRPNPPTLPAPAYHSEEQARPPRPPPPTSAPTAPQSMPTQPPVLPFNQPQAYNPASYQPQQYYYPPPPLPSGFNPYAVPQQQQPQQQQMPYPQMQYPVQPTTYGYPPNTGYAQYPYPPNQ
ncbi:programmed cell death 6-interacting protein-like [Oppia nitens]|uniref:programmed cell death 6-interacting protein-like n=1 Tax=Oppia nitens TaxID=1686743 RepID=UPI0023D9B350|nr:programmed cell death 6-interacting protein-like [Oppia nitens]